MFRHTPVVVVAVIMMLAGGSLAVANSGGSNHGNDRNHHGNSGDGHGQQGPRGPRGPQGPQGPAGKPAPEGLTGWGPMLRNEYGSPVAETGTTSTGQNALILATQSGEEKAEYGTETELAGTKISSLSAIGFDAYVTDGDVSFGAAYQPNIQMEVNPKVAGKTYSSLVWVPPTSALKINEFSGYIDAMAAVTNHGTEGWWFSNGAVAAATNCSQAHFCSWAEVLAAAPETEVSFSVGLGKGRDQQFQGAIREFRFGSSVYTFGPGGTFKK